MLAKEIVTAFLDEVTSDRDAASKYLKNTTWTLLATGALVKVAGRSSEGRDVHVAARGFKDPTYGRSEYLSLDVCAYDNSSWGPPLFIAEHENSPSLEKIRYCAWKLLVTEATRRVLVAYFTEEFSSVVNAVKQVAAANPGGGAPRDVLVIAAPWGARPSSLDELRGLFQSQIVGDR